ncbi:unnamed protein product [Gongylonema pulchrum]|uniref:Uncharacterized protein n=1 Tax=Gongylonema pulchrum TaxID=637853 RepID=A0A183EUQ7_9BILA|nr:unnamed protein product [Gongylonema pulchrum]
MEIFVIDKKCFDPLSRIHFLPLPQLDLVSTTIMCGDVIYMGIRGKNAIFADLRGGSFTFDDMFNVRWLKALHFNSQLLLTESTDGVVNIFMDFKMFAVNFYFEFRCILFWCKFLFIVVIILFFFLKVSNFCSV